MKEINYPAGSQLLFFPMKECTVAAGFKNAKYPGGHKGVIHYGVDFDDRWGKSYDALASGEGIVLGTEKNSNNSIGGVVVIRYDNVYNPTIGKIQSLVARYYHFETISVVKGQKVKAYQKIGVIGVHKWWNHIHMEIDTDIKHPFHTPQVAEGSSKLLIRSGANDKTLLNPMDVLVVGKQQTAMVHSKATYADKVKDAPKYSEGNSVKIEVKEELKEDVKKDDSGVQKLVFPIKSPKITCGYKNKNYKTTYGFNHYGLDMVSNTGMIEIYGLGNGTVIAAGWDGVGPANGAKKNTGCGYVLIVQYNDVYNHITKKKCNVVCTMMHLKSAPLVKKGDKVTTSTLLGYYGATGAYVTGAHLHVQFDTDTKYPLACMPMGSVGHKILKKGSIDSTVDPSELLHLGQGQQLYYGNSPSMYDKTKLQKIPYAN